MESKLRDLLEKGKALVPEYDVPLTLFSGWYTPRDLQAMLSNWSNLS